jgi:hypothetical protein
MYAAPAQITEDQLLPPRRLDVNVFIGSFGC